MTTAAPRRARRGRGRVARPCASCVPLVLRLAETRSPVLLEGESGTGKDLVAHWLHYGGPRREGPFIKVHCPSIPEELLESELFGHEKGAFTDARHAKAGKIEMAAGGTLYFDQVQDLVPPLQAKLLRVVEERRFERVGGTRTIEVDVRFVASANVDLAEAVRGGALPRGPLPPPERGAAAARAAAQPARGRAAARRGRSSPASASAGATAASGFAPETAEVLKGYSVAGQRARAALGGRARRPRRARGRGRRRAALPPQLARAAGDAVGGARPPAHPEGRRAGLHPLRARRGGRQPDAGGGGARASGARRCGRRGAATGSARGEGRTSWTRRSSRRSGSGCCCKKQEILEAYNKNKTYGKEADGEATQDIADKAANSYTKEFLFSLSNTERDLLQQVDEALVRHRGPPLRGLRRRARRR